MPSSAFTGHQRVVAFSDLSRQTVLFPASVPQSTDSVNDEESYDSQEVHLRSCRIR